MWYEYYFNSVKLFLLAFWITLPESNSKSPWKKTPFASKEYFEWKLQPLEFQNQLSLASFQGMLIYLYTPPPPKFNSEFTPEKCWKASLYLLAFFNFSGANC